LKAEWIFEECLSPCIVRGSQLVRLTSVFNASVIKVI